MGAFLDNSTFYHIPRTGGTWVEEVVSSGAVSSDVALMDKYVKGFDALINRKHIPPTVIKPNNFSFSFVRHPLDWYKSIWKYKTKRNDRKWSHWNYSELSAKCGRDDFGEFIDMVIKTFSDGFYNKIISKFSSVDFMGRQENLVDDLITALTIAKETFDEKSIRNCGKRNRSRYIDLNYTMKQKEKLLKMEKSIIDTYY
jgi:hypothetical protein